MKKLIVFVVLLGFGLTMSAQGKFNNFFGKVPISKTTEKGLTGQWLPRPAFSTTAMQVPLLKNEEPRFVNAFGAGIGYGLFTEQNGESYQVVAFTLSAMFGTSKSLLGEEKGEFETTVSLGVTGWQYVNFGVGYNFGVKQPVLLLNLVYSFN